MPDHPQSSLTEPAEAFRETFLYWIEDPEHHDATRRFGKLLEQLVGEAHIVVRNRREHPPSRTWVAATIRAVLLDLAHLRSVVADIAENIGAPLPGHEVRLMVAVSDLLPELDAWTAKLATTRGRGVADKGLRMYCKMSSERQHPPVPAGGAYPLLTRDFPGEWRIALSA